MTNYFALFVDLMGVQQYFVAGPETSAAEQSFAQCRESLEEFHHDLATTIDSSLLLLYRLGINQPEFVAEFSDSAYIVSDRFVSVAMAASTLMRKAIRHKYPLRGGIGAGSFSHEVSGVRTGRDNQIWTTSSFLGGAVIAAYQAERSNALGLRVFIHPSAMGDEADEYLTECALPLPATEASVSSEHELRFWRPYEVKAATDHLTNLQKKQSLTDRARLHYEATHTAYARMAEVDRDLSLVGPALWLF